MTSGYSTTISVSSTGSLAGDSPSPLALIFANKIRQALNNAEYSSELTGFEGCFGIQSKTDPQAISITKTKQQVVVSSGLSSQCDITIVLDLNHPSAKPTVKSLWRHPMFAIKVGKILDFPTVLWADALKRFWDQHQDQQGMPEGMIVKCADEDRRLSVGNMDSACYFEGNARDLAEAFNGDTPFVQMLATGRLTGHYTFEQATVLSDLTMQMMLGDTSL